jgi:hypothetical protein
VLCYRPGFSRFDRFRFTVPKSGFTVSALPGMHEHPTSHFTSSPKEIMKQSACLER